MMIVPRRIPQFSILSVLVTMAFVALVILLVRNTLTISTLQSRLASAHQQIESLETYERQLRDSIEKEFFGLHGEPLLSVDPASTAEKPIAIPNLEH